MGSHHGRQVAGLTITVTPHPRDWCAECGQSWGRDDIAVTVAGVTICDKFTTPAAVARAILDQLTVSFVPADGRVVIISNDGALASFWRENYGESLFDVVSYDAPDLTFDCADEEYDVVLVHASLRGSVWAASIVTALERLKTGGQVVAVVPAGWQVNPWGNERILPLFLAENVNDFTHVTTPLPANSLAVYGGPEESALLYIVRDDGPPF